MNTFVPDEERYVSKQEIELARELDFKRGFKPRTVEDLLAIPLMESRRPVRPIVDPYEPELPDFTPRLKAAFASYSMRAAKNQAPLSTYNRRWIDRLRYNLHCTLLRWGVII